jgi:hypothetical protein
MDGIQRLLKWSPRVGASHPKSEVAWPFFVRSQNQLLGRWAVGCALAVGEHEGDVGLVFALRTLGVIHHGSKARLAVPETSM